EGSIPDFHVTGVQTCALPISGTQRLSVPAKCPVVRTSASPGRVDDAEARAELDPAAGQRIVAIANDGDEAIIALNSLIDWVNAKIGRASCRERVQIHACTDRQ